MSTSRLTAEPDPGAMLKMLVQMGYPVVTGWKETRCPPPGAGSLYVSQRVPVFASVQASPDCWRPYEYTGT